MEGSWYVLAAISAVTLWIAYLEHRYNVVKGEKNALREEKNALREEKNALREQVSNQITRERDSLREFGLCYFSCIVRHHVRLIGCKPYREMNEEEKESLFIVLSFLEYMSKFCDNSEVDEAMFKKIYGPMILEYYDK